jgi:hypothetical protein
MWRDIGLPFLVAQLSAAVGIAWITRGLGIEMARLADFHRAHAGEALIVAGTGPSLGLLPQPCQFPTIGLNAADRFIKPDYLFCLHLLPPKKMRYVRGTSARAIFAASNLWFSEPRIIETPIRGGDEPLDDPDALHVNLHRGCTAALLPAAAITLAVHMGATAVGLIGIDLDKPQYDKLTIMRSEYRLAVLADVLNRHSVQCFNLGGEQSRLLAFPRMTVAEFGERYGG